MLLSFNECFTILKQCDEANHAELLSTCDRFHFHTLEYWIECPHRYLCLIELDRSYHKLHWWARLSVPRTAHRRRDEACSSHQRQDSLCQCCWRCRWGIKIHCFSSGLGHILRDFSAFSSCNFLPFLQKSQSALGWIRGPIEAWIKSAGKEGKIRRKVNALREKCRQISGERNALSCGESVKRPNSKWNFGQEKNWSGGRGLAPGYIWYRWSHQKVSERWLRYEATTTHT